MDLTLLQSYIAFKAPSPRSMLFLYDPAHILPTDGSLAVLDRKFDIISYENDLQLRDVMERYKDDMKDRRFCIVSSKGDDENLFIQDYIARSSVIDITPQALLEFLQKGYHWSEEVNQLRGADFWENVEKLQKSREAFPGYISSVECSNVILSAILNIDLSKALLPTEAIGLQKRLDNDERIAQLREKCPDLVSALEQMVQEAIPLMARIGQDEDLTKLMWISYSLGQRNDNYELFLPRILGHEVWQKYGEMPLDRMTEICEQLIERDTERVVEQIKVVEEWLSQDEERMRIFKDWIGVSNASIVKTAEFAASERIFCIPLKDALRTVARAIVSSSASAAITPQLRENILKNITARHIFLLDDSTYMRLRDTFDAFTRLCEFLDLVGEIRKKDWWRSKERQDDIELWTREIYPRYLSRVELLRDRIETLNFRCDLLSSALMQKVSDDARQILTSLGERFADLIQKYYPRWVAGTETPKPLLITDFVSQVFQPLFDKYIKEDQQAAYIIVFDGMRWDQWELLRPKILQTFQGRLALEDVIPLIANLPSTTEWARKAIFAGAFPADFSAESEGELLEAALGVGQVAQVQTSGEAPAKRDRVLEFLEDRSQIKPIIFNLIDTKLHGMMQNLVTLHEEVEVNFDNTIQPYLEKIPSDSLVFIVSDHGFVEITSKGTIAPNRNEAEPHRRYIGLRSFSPRSDISTSDFILFSTENIRMPSVSNIVKYGFARPGRFITSAREQESGRTIRYAHGGV
ncbi:PglZ domain-containing protein, partial [Candidatus Poribacteria bacterium]